MLLIFQNISHTLHDHSRFESDFCFNITGIRESHDLHIDRPYSLERPFHCKFLALDLLSFFRFYNSIAFRMHEMFPNNVWLTISEALYYWCQ